MNLTAAGSVVVAIPDTHSRTAPVWLEESLYAIWEQATDGPAYLFSLRSVGTAEAGSGRREVYRMGKHVLKDLLSWRSYKLAASHPPPPPHLLVTSFLPIFSPLAGLAFWSSRLDYCLGRFLRQPATLGRGRGLSRCL